MIDTSDMLKLNLTSGLKDCYPLQIESLSKVYRD